MNHRFHDRDWVENYAENITKRRPERLEAFAHMAEQIQTLNQTAPTVIELGAGPGLLAAALLEALPTMQYLGLDFSQEMIRVAKQKTVAHSDRCSFQCKNLCSETWHHDLPEGIDAIVSNMALHDLGSAEAVEAVYKQSRAHLKPGGLFINAELVLTEDHGGKTNGGRFKIPRHLEILNALGYDRVVCPLDFGHYACIQAHRPNA